ncbi:MAG TPA: hypothetical protein ENJ52_14845 [Aliiroseovarius sp.]|nr:hypothetical protein [Aliiroseovarius sp.]
MKISNALCGAALAMSASIAGAQAQDWSGAYAGLFAGSSLNVTTATTSGVQGLRLGYGWESDKIVYGGEIELGGYSGSTDTYVQISGRAGYVNSSDIFLYGILGLNQHSTAGNAVLFGLGAELMIGEDLSLRADAVQMYRSGSGDRINTLTVGLSWNF